MTVSGKTSATATYKQENLIEYQRVDTLTGKLKTKFRITEFSYGDYRLDMTLVNSDTINFSQIIFQSGRQERENDPEILEILMSLAAFGNPDNIFVEGNFKQSLVSGRVIKEGPCHNDQRDGQWKFYFPQEGFVYLPDYQQGKVIAEHFQNLQPPIH